MYKNVVAGMGEIGNPIFKLFSKNFLTVGYDIDSSRMNTSHYSKFEKNPVSFLHICIPFNKKFATNVVSLYGKFSPEIIVIHSTIPPNTTEKIQKKLDCPVIYSATRGTHRRMLKDLKRFVKFFALTKSPKSNNAAKKYVMLLRSCGIKAKQMSSPVTLELAKIIVDTTYYGWLITYAQLSNMIARKYGVDYDEMWTFSEDINKFLSRGPKMFPGFIGGHCVIPNLKLIDEDDLYLIDKINNIYAKKVKNAKTIAKKYIKGKQSYTGT